ncbi:MAG: T9SS type A sorting domain-containing protein [Bacteroidales bacterium]|nr:T9SS type A sorting domain-containing protein [Bacteroidales bacterium]
MKTFLYYIFCILLPFPGMGQCYLFEDFSSVFPPTGWTVEGGADNWYQSDTREAFGVWPECRLHFYPIFTTTSRLVSPPIDLTGVNSVEINFLYSITNKGADFSVGVATRTNNGPWHTVWEYPINSIYNVYPAFKHITVSNEDTGKPGFQCCLFLTPGSTSYTFFDWYLDNFHLYRIPEHEIRMSHPGYLHQLNHPFTYTPLTNIRNIGQQSETFPAYARIYDATGNQVYIDSLVVANLGPNITKTLQFSGYLFPANQYHTVQIYTALSTDGDRNDDTTLQVVTTYDHSKQAVIMELSTSTGCGYCPAAEEGLDSMVAIGYDIGVAAYHNCYSDPYANDYGVGRVNNYGFWGLPTVYADGYYCMVGVYPGEPMFDYYVKFYENLIAIKSPFGIYINGSHTGNHYLISLTTEGYGPVLNRNLVVQCVLTESGIVQYPGWEPLNYVERLMIPDENGTVLDPFGPALQQIDLEFDTDPAWNTNELNLVIFIQDADTREVLNGEVKALINLYPLIRSDQPGTQEVTTGYFYPNPFSSVTTLPLELNEPGEVTVTIYDMNGIVVKSLYHGLLSTGSSKLRWNGVNDHGTTLPGGRYLCRIITTQEVVTRSVMLVR